MTTPLEVPVGVFILTYVFQLATLSQLMVICWQLAPAIPPLGQAMDFTLLTVPSGSADSTMTVAEADLVLSALDVAVML